MQEQRFMLYGYVLYVTAITCYGHISKNMLKFAARASTHTHTRIWPLIELGGYLIQFVTPPTHVVIAIGYRPDDIGSPSQMIYEGKVGTSNKQCI